MKITLYEKRRCLWDVSHKDYLNRDSKDVAYSQIDLLMSDKYAISREDYKNKWKSVIIAHMRSSFVFATTFPRFATGAAKHSVCFPLV